MSDFGIFMGCAPGLEAWLAEEAVERGFDGVEAVGGGVICRGDWPEVWRANLEMRGASRVLVRVAEFRAFHLAQMDKRARKVAWGEVLRPDVPVRVEATCRKSKIYHAGAAAQRVERAIAEELGAPLAKDAEIVVKVRIEDDLVSVSLDSSGEGLHKRGHKTAVGKAPMRETMAALFLRACGYQGGETVVDPMCGSGTFPIEAAEIAAGLQAGRGRSFAFERLAGFDAGAVDPLGRMMVHSGGYREMTRMLMEAADELCGGRLVMSHEGGYSPSMVPYCGLAVMEQLSGISTGIVDPMLDIMAGYGQQALQPHQAAAIDTAAKGVIEGLTGGAG